MQGKGIVNSISLKDGEDEFLRRRRARARATARPSSSWRSTNRARPSKSTTKFAFASGRSKLLTEQVGFPPEDIIFDPNILTVATGIEEHNNYAINFIEATRRDQTTSAPAAKSAAA